MKKNDTETRKELSGKLYNQYLKDGKGPDGNPIILTRAEFDKKVLKGSNYQSKAKLEEQVKKRTCKAKISKNRRIKK